MTEKPKLLYVTRKEHFNAAHKLYNPNWSDEKNEEVFGLCANKNWHGHNFELIVTVKGNINLDTGFVIDLKKLKTIIREKIIDKIDHSNINMDVDFMKEKIASIENIVTAIWHEIEQPIANENCTLHYIKLIETVNNYVEYYGE